MKHPVVERIDPTYPTRSIDDVVPEAHHGWLLEGERAKARIDYHAAARGGRHEYGGVHACLRVNSPWPVLAGRKATVEAAALQAMRSVVSDWRYKRRHAFNKYV